jgi:hypothetical protein
MLPLFGMDALAIFALKCDIIHRHRYWNIFLPRLGMNKLSFGIPSLFFPSDALCRLVCAEKLPVNLLNRPPRLAFLTSIRRTNQQNNNREGTDNTTTYGSLSIMSKRENKQPKQQST